MARLHARARQVVRTGGFVGVTATMLPLFVARLASAAPERREEVREAWIRAWARALLRLFAITIDVEGSVPPTSTGRLIVANHRSAADIGVILSLFGGYLVSRADLATWPVLGAAARSVGTVFVDRSSARSGAAAIRASVSLLEQGRVLSVFPEGTTFSDDEVRPFHAGAFVAATRADVDILPVGIAYPRGSGAAFFDETFGSHLGRMARAEPTRVFVSIGTPFRPARGDRSAAIAERARAEVQALVERSRARDPAARNDAAGRD